MKNLFSWRLKPSDKDITDLWKNAIFVFDTNFLLDLYRISHSTAKDFLNILEHLEERIWLPYQVASEFLNRREETIDSEARSFEKALKALEKWKDEQLGFHRLKGLLGETGRIVNSEVAFLFEQQDTYKAVVEEVEKCFKDKIEELDKTHSSLNSEEDYILEKILTLFDGKVGESCNEATLQKLYKEGEERYKQKKPPGFMDAKEKEDERQYGDFILWKQTLDFAKTKSCSIVLVTGEKKEDWWTKKGGAIVSPHLELRREFKEQVNQLFWMYQTQHFLEIAREKLEIEISPRSIEEANVVAEAEAAEEKSYEEISQVVRQIQTAIITEDLLKAFRTPTINEGLLKGLSTPTINEDLLKAFRTPTINEGLLKGLSTSAISEGLLKGLSTSAISEGLLKGLSTSAISEGLLKGLSTSAISEGLLKGLSTSAISEGLLKAYSQAYKSAIDNAQLTLKSEENTAVREDMNFDLSTEIPDEQISEQHSNREKDSADNSNSRENKSEVRSQNIKPKAKRRSSPKK